MLRNILRYIFSFFLILTLLGLGESVIIKTSNVKNSKQSEWVNKISQTRKISKCYQYSLCFLITKETMNLHSLWYELSIFYNQIVSVKLLSQTSLLHSNCYKILKFNKLHTPRNSVENHFASTIRTDSFTKFCPSSAIQHDVGIIKWNQILNGKWIKGLINPLVSLMGLNALQNGYGEQYI